VEQQDSYSRRLAAIAFADVAGWSRLIEQNDAATLTAWKAVRSELIEPKIQEHSGRLLEIAGDAVLVEFPSAVAAVKWAVDLQKGLADRNIGGAAPTTLTMRVGVNVEDVIVDGDKLVGSGVNVAARIQQLAEPGEILVTKAVHDYVHNKMSIALEDLGERHVKNISRALQLYRVRDKHVRQPQIDSDPASPATAGGVLLTIERATPDPQGAGVTELEQLVQSIPLPSKPARSLAAAAGAALVLEFRSAREAAESAFAIRKESSQHATLRMGIETREQVAGRNGHSAARLSGVAGPREILVSAEIRDQLIDGLDVSLEDLGEHQLSGSKRKVRTFRVSPPGTGTAPPGGARPPGSRGGGDRPSIAVLPFRNLSGDPANDYLGDVIAEDVIGALSRLTDLIVISRLSTAAFRSRPYEPRGVAEALGVRYVLSGSLYTSGSRLRITADLSDAASGHVVWAERFESSLTAIFDLQDQLARAISQRLVPYMRQRELQRARSEQPETLSAYERTLRGIDHFHRSTQRDLDTARSLLESAIEADPSYVTPYAWLAHWHVRRVGQGWAADPQRDAIEANRYSEAALEKDATHPHALTISGAVKSYLDKDLEGAIELHNRALTINPSAAPAWAWSTAAYAWLGDGNEAVRRSHRAIELSPFDPQMYFFTSTAGAAHAVAGLYDTAIELLRRSLRLNRLYTSSHRILTLSLSLSGRRDDARKAAAELLMREPNLTASGFLKRYPGSESAHARTFAEALADAGVPP
jgi:class 3 adenylate cyclase/TolB-like protein/Tfp pilus assembly protein PilF